MSSPHRPPPLFLLFSFVILYSAGVLTALDHCSFLLDLKKSFNSTSELATWLPNTNCCNWDGVTCNNLTGRVTGLDLSHRYLAGKIGNSLFNLTSLEKLNLAYNLFDGSPIPKGFELLTNLTSLNLSNAGFSGQVPVGIAKLTNLVSLDLSTFLLNELPADSLNLMDPDLQTLIGNLSNLKELFLDGVNIWTNRYEWSAAVGRWTPKLRALSLSGCSITGPIGSSFAELRDLSIIRLNENNLNCSVPEFFGNFSSLSVVQLSQCGLSGILPTSMFLLKNLTSIDLSSNPMLSGSFPEFSDASKLESLMLSKTNFSGSLPYSIGKLKSLKTMLLSTCQFTGTIPSSISNLTQLVDLDLSSNAFSGAIPSIMPPRISKLILSNNTLKGPIPSSIGNCKQLVNLNLDNNRLSGTIPGSLFALPSLQMLSLNMNELSGELEEFSDGSSQLEIIDLSNNGLQGRIPRSVFQLSGLKVLQLAFNDFAGILELNSFSSLKNLSSLDLSYNNLTIRDEVNNGSSFPQMGTLSLASCNLSEIPDFLRYQENMNALDLSNNNIHGAIPNWIWSIGNSLFNYLNLSQNYFSTVEGLVPNFSMKSSIIIDLHSNILQGPIPLIPVDAIVLDYSSNKFSSSIPSNITQYLSFTIFFSLANNNISGEIPVSICNAGSLQVIDFSSNKLSGTIPPCLLEGRSDLAVLSLGGNQLEGSIPENIGEGCRLKTVNLNSNNLVGDIPKSLANCNQLEILDIGNNQLNSPFPFFLGEVHSLRVLVLRSNKLYGPVEGTADILESNYSLPMLQIFDISSNNFSGSIPLNCLKSLKSMMMDSVNRSSLVYKYLPLTSMSYLDKMTVTFNGLELELVRTLMLFILIDFSNNAFEGPIPAVVGDLKSLIVLNLSHNALTGDIPPSIGNLMQLEFLDLSNNHLSGNIPGELCNLTFLSFLNLSNNNLTGTIPQENQFSTFSAVSFEGNTDLCGPPLTEQCSSGRPILHASGSATDVDWRLVFIGLGFGTALAVFLGTLMLWETARKWYLKNVDVMLFAIVPSQFGQICAYLEDWRAGVKGEMGSECKRRDLWNVSVQFPQLCDYCGERRVGAEEGMERDSTEIDDDERHCKRFCVFCTQLEFFEGKVLIHHVECDCASD